MRRGPSLVSSSAATTKRSLLFCTVFASTVGGRRCHAGWVDPDTPEKFLTTMASYRKDTREYELVRG